MRKLTFLGTGTGMPRKSCCSSLLLDEDDNHLIIDLAGGQELRKQFFAIDREMHAIRNVFISHYDTDHILGIYPLIREYKAAGGTEQINIFCSPEVKEAIESMFKVTGHQHFNAVKPRLRFVLLTDGMSHTLGTWQMTFFDLRSPRTPQFGFSIRFPDGKRFVFLGDEPAKPAYERYLQDADYIVYNAFCLEKDIPTMRPHEKNHSTARDAAEIAQRFNVKHLLLFHMEDLTLATRKEAYTEEARRFYRGSVFVPVDLDTFTF